MRISELTRVTGYRAENTDGTVDADGEPTLTPGDVITDPSGARLTFAAAIDAYRRFSQATGCATLPAFDPNDRSHYYYRVGVTTSENRYVRDTVANINGVATDRHRPKEKWDGITFDADSRWVGPEALTASALSLHLDFSAVEPRELIVEIDGSVPVDLRAGDRSFRLSGATGFVRMTAGVTIRPERVPMENVSGLMLAEAQGSMSRLAQLYAAHLNSVRAADNALRDLTKVGLGIYDGWDSKDRAIKARDAILAVRREMPEYRRLAGVLNDQIDLRAIPRTRPALWGDNGTYQLIDAPETLRVPEAP